MIDMKTFQLQHAAAALALTIGTVILPDADGEDRPVCNISGGMSGYRTTKTPLNMNISTYHL